MIMNIIVLLNRMSYIVGLVFLCKMIFLDDMIDLGIIDKYYWITSSILLSILVVTEIIIQIQRYRFKKRTIK